VRPSGIGRAVRNVHATSKGMAAFPERVNGRVCTLAGAYPTIILQSNSAGRRVAALKWIVERRE
jgi:hypothetical protein